MDLRTVSCLLMLCLFQGVLYVTAKLDNEIIELKSEEEECIEELNLDKVEIQLLNSQSIIPEDNPRFNDFLACYWQKMNWQDKYNGDINFNNIKEVFENVIIEEFSKELSLIRVLVRQMLLNVVRDCKDNTVKGSSHGQTVAIAQNCIIRSLNHIKEDILSTDQ